MAGAGVLVGHGARRYDAAARGDRRRRLRAAHAWRPDLAREEGGPGDSRDATRRAVPGPRGPPLHLLRGIASRLVRAAVADAGRARGARPGHRRSRALHAARGLFLAALAATQVVLVIWVPIAAARPGRWRGRLPAAHSSRWRAPGLGSLAVSGSIARLRCSRRLRSRCRASADGGRRGPARVARRADAVGNPRAFSSSCWRWQPGAAARAGHRRDDTAVARGRSLAGRPSWRG